MGEIKQIEGITCPEWLDAQSKVLFWGFARQLERWKILEPVDVPLLAAMCNHWAQYELLQERINLEGATVEDSKGSIKTHPAARIQRQHLEMYMAIAKRFGLTPLDREAITISKSDGKVKATGKQVSLR